MISLLRTGESRVEGAFLPTVTARWVHQLEHGSPVRFQVLEPAVAAVLDGNWPHADSPGVAAIATRRSARQATGARVDAALAVEVGDTTIAGLVAEVVAIDPAVLDRGTRLRYMLLCDKISSWGQAHAAKALATYAGPAARPGSDGAAEARRDRQLRLEVRVARRISDDAAARDIDAARRLAAELAPGRGAWSQP